MVPSALRFSSKPVLLPESAESLVLAPEPLSLNPHQKQAMEKIVYAMSKGRSQTILVHGVTASGKTELYLQAASYALSQKRSAIILIPEIALTAQTVDRFCKRFGERVMVWHSRMSIRARADSWRRMMENPCVVVGARSAVFAPVTRLGLVVIDEEHETAYKQQDLPRYHARDVAVARAREIGAVVLLGSATPSVESYYAAKKRSAGFVYLPQRIFERPMPEVEIVDMRLHLGQRRIGVLSPRLERLLQQVVDRGEQGMLLLNRRGFARVAQCKGCGAVTRCARCAVPLIFHADRQQMLCHYCNFQSSPKALCEQCKKGYVLLRGMGTERVESELHRLFPQAAIARMDRDTTLRKESHRELYEAVRTRQVGLLVGTQMIAKGLDFPEVTLVGVVSADTGLNLPDFRSGERTFDLLTQMAGRAGRGPSPGRVVIQTYCPHHYAIQAAAKHDYEKFYAEEIQMRRQLHLPPFSRLVEMTLASQSKSRVESAASRLAEELRGLFKRGVHLLGPVPHRIPRLRKVYRSCILLKSITLKPVAPVLKRVLGPNRTYHGVHVRIDVDPL
ncbi:MAG: primosomal protein N' [Candidatus Omnitrophica bacterium]|nr:primosomal protein N' [Candidatus Omnitrophota bacterium]